MATQNLSNIRESLPHYPRRFQPSLTPPYHNDPKPDGPWSSQGGQGGSGDNHPMSILSTGEARSERNTPQIPPIQSYPPMQPPYRSPREAPVNPPVSLPPLRHLLETPPTPSDRTFGNPFENHSILNPQAELVEQQRALKRSNPHMDSPSPVDTQNSQSLPSISRPNSVDSTQSTQEGQQHARPFQPPERPPIRSLYHEKGIRTHSLSRLNPPTGTIDAHQSPFLTASTRPSEMMTTQSALPTPPAGGRTHYFPATAPTPPPNMMRTEIRRPSVNFPQSGSASPIAQYSPYSQPASVASSQYDNNSTQGQYGPMRRHTPTQDSRQGSVSMESKRNSMIAMAPSSQSSVQLMTIQSQDGSLHNIQVETQTASKSADEKRRRNAGASARFRARRKEKEREASISISRLEQNVRDSNEHAEYYRSERDYWRSIAMQAQPERHITRPPSPRLRRVSVAPSRAPSFTAGHGSEASYDGYEEKMREGERNVRRRTSSYHPAIGLHHIDVSALSHESTFRPVNSHHQQAQFADPQPTAKRPAYRDSFPPEANRYEHRS